MAFILDQLLRENIKNLKPYSSARDEFSGVASVYLDANENSFGSSYAANPEYNRYPDPMQAALKEKLSTIKGVPPKNIFIGNGSDEAIDILFRAFCRPGIDNAIITPPTYGMYEVSAGINDAAVRKVNLTDTFQLNLEGIAEAIDGETKLIFLCSPNNPTGNSLDRSDVETVLANFNGIVVIDEAYINFSKQRSFIRELTEYSNLVVLQTLSKAWGLAALRVGMAFASEEIIEVFNRVKPPYNVNKASQDMALEALENVGQVNHWIAETVAERDRLAAALVRLPTVEKVFPSDANFLLVKIDQPKNAYTHLMNQGIIVRDRSSVVLCEGCLRITVGTPDQNSELVISLTAFQP